MKRFLEVAVLSCVLTVPTLFAQFEAGEVLGTVHDPSGAAIPAVSVTLTNQDTGILEKTTTNNDGEYNFFNVKQGRYSLEFDGKGRQFGSYWNPVLDAVAGGWELNMINSAHTGQPIDVAYYTVPTAINVTPGLSNDYRGQAEVRPNVSGQGVGSQATGQYINNYFAGYTFTQPTTQNPFGNLGRNAFRAPDFEQWDVAVDKNFHIAERFNLQFRSEFFNILNETNFLTPDTRLNDASFGTIRATFPPRQIQFGLKLLF